MKRNKKFKNIITKIIGIISLIIYIIFSSYLLILNMIPSKYLAIYFVSFSVLYLIFIFFIFYKKIKLKIKIVSSVFLIIFAIIFGIGIKYLGETINFVDVINNKLFQKETYYVMVLEDSSIKTIEELKNKNIGLYNSKNSEDALSELQLKTKINHEEYKDIIEMLEKLEDGLLDAVLINDSIINLLSTDLKHLGLELKEIHKVYIEIEKQDVLKIVDVTTTPFNIYIAGGDAYGSIENVTNTDVNMVVSVDPVNRKILLTSIPRDYYVNLPSFGENAYDKLTHAGYYGVEESIISIEKLLDIDINYYIKVNFSTIQGVIDSIGGVDLYNDIGFYEDAFKTYYFKEGMIHLDGKMALAFARERKSFIDGDVQRVKNQQKVIEAIIKKITSSTSLITGYSDILSSVSENLSTNMDTKSINRFVKMQLNDMRGWNIESINLIGTDLYTTNTYTFPGVRLYVMEQDENSVNEIKEKIKNFLK